MKYMDERRLLKKLQNGDEKAFEKIIDIYSAYIVKIVGSLISSKGTKEDTLKGFLSFSAKNSPLSARVIEL